ncbi:hypothetical protein Y1Q_0023555 [Alligator mississippiensis]|uniref:Uncharacterized protein n=1 Tax=Alligator mississippiensis TaxID=8496 RepID=A0A151MMG5_ALLMI|nr:hypothetical protein Y1Q_0023555 [Alligator mississippiensis]
MAPVPDSKMRKWRLKAATEQGPVLQEASGSRGPACVCRAVIMRLRLLTPAYFRLLQLQLSGVLECEPKDRLVNHTALLLAIMGLSLSYYSVRQLAKPVKPPPAQ